MLSNSSVDHVEVAKFDQHASQWWDENGPLKTLHHINPTRLAFIETIHPLKEQRVLDIGCGGGILTESMARQGANVIGLDVAADAIACAKQHAKANQVNVDYVCQPLEEYNAPAFNLITCMEMLEHVTHPQIIIEHAVRLLMPGGYLFLSTINRSIAAYLGIILAGEYILKLLPRQTHDYTKFIRPSELARITRAYHMETIALQGIDYNPFMQEARLSDSVKMNYLMACQKI